LLDGSFFRSIRTVAIMKSLGALLCFNAEEKLESYHGTQWALEKQNNNYRLWLVTIILE